MLEALLSETHVPEREMFDRNTANALSRLLSRMAAVNRYRIARKYAYGRVADAACGCGYGSWLLSKCPAVSAVRGFDGDETSVEYARFEYGDSSDFEVLDFCSPDAWIALAAFAPDTIVSLETIEHLRDGAAFVQAVKDSKARRWVVSFPSFETVTFNKYHLKDWTPEEIAALVGWEPTVKLHIDDAVWMLVFDL